MVVVKKNIDLCSIIVIYTVIWINHVFARSLFFFFLGSSPCGGASVKLRLILESVELSCPRRLAFGPKDKRGTVLRISPGWRLFGINEFWTNPWAKLCEETADDEEGRLHGNKAVVKESVLRVVQVEGSIEAPGIQCRSCKCDAELKSELRSLFRLTFIPLQRACLPFPFR